MANDLTVYHHVNELMSLFEMKDKPGHQTLSANAITEHLLKNRTANVTVPVQGLACAKSLSETVSNSELVMKKYEVLRMKNKRELDPTVSLLSQIVTSSGDKKSGNVKHLLKRNAEHRAKVHVATGQHTKTGNFSVPEMSYQVQQQLAKDKYDDKDHHSLNIGSLGLVNLQAKELDRGLSWDFNIITAKEGCGLGDLPLHVQEYHLIEDLLYCLGGINGDYIYMLPVVDGAPKREMYVDETCHTSYQVLVRRMLPICQYFSTVVRFVEERNLFQHGLVNHALAASMRHLLKDFYILIAQLEHQFATSGLTLQKVWFYLQPTEKNMCSLAYVCDNITQGQCHGGMVLSVLHRILTCQTGDAKMQDVLIYLLQAASIPYFEILEKWIYKGIITDPYKEFFVVDNHTDKQKDCTFNSDEYWEKKYTICRDQIPLFLEKVWDRILRTGKYLNVIQQCGYDIKFPTTERMVYSSEQHQYIEQTEKAYNYASKMLLKMLMDDCDLMGRLRSIKHYFLMDQGDFVVQFMDMAEEELCKDINILIPTRLEFLLELALRTSVVNSDKYKDDLGTVIQDYDLVTQMLKIHHVGDPKMPEEFSSADAHEFCITGIEAFSFQYNVKWPLSLVINQHSKSCYQMLFRLLFFCKYVERLLGNVWSMNKVAKSYSLDASRGYASAFALRQRMLSFIQAIEYYMNFEVIEPHWHKLLTKMQDVSNVDDVILFHSAFLDSCMKDCMLMIPELLKTLVKLLKLCVSFSNFMKTTHKDAVEAELTLIGVQNPTGTQNLDDSQLTTSAAEESNMNMPLSFKTRISNFHSDFNDSLAELLKLITSHDKVHYSDKLVNMWYRLDFNGFYITELQLQG